MKLVGITGKTGSGKTTVANVFSDQGFLQYSFRTPAEAAIKDMFNIPDEYLEDAELYNQPLPGLHLSPGDLVESLYDTWGINTLGPEFWLYFAARYWHKLNLPPLKSQGWLGLLIDGVETEEEADWIRSENGIIIHVDRPSQRSQMGPSIKTNKLDYILINDSSIDYLEKNINSIIAALSGKKSGLH